MKKLLSLVLFLCSMHSVNAQLISFELLQSYSLEDLQQVLDDVGVPPGLIDPIYPVDYYQVIYETPYLTADNLVMASGAIAVPQSAGCSFPIAAYHHGTQSRKLSGASTRSGAQWEVGLIFASTGYTVTMMDNLGLGLADDSVPIPPYIHTFSAGNTSVDLLRSCRTMSDSLGFELNGQLFLFGYSQGGFDTMATQRVIEEDYPDEFTVTASAPMSGPYDLVEAQVDLIVADLPYPTPGYLPYIVLSYQSIYGNLYNDISEFLVSPYDTLIPNLFYSGEYSIGHINNQCTEVPRDMVPDSTLQAFINMPDHPLRENLKENDLVSWTPTAPVKLLYCFGDDQVSYLNSENAYDAWTANGAPVEKLDLGDADHNGCALFCFLNGKTYFDSYRIGCGGVPVESMINFEPSLYPNPSDGRFTISGIEGRFVVDIMDVMGKTVHQIANNSEIGLEHLNAGTYVCHITAENGQQYSEKIVLW